MCEKKILFGTFLIAMLLAISGLLLWFGTPPPVRAQNSGQTGTQTVSVQVLNASSATGPFGCNGSGGACQGINGVFPNIGQAAHYLHYCTTATTLQLRLEEAPDGVNYAPFTIAYGVPTDASGCAVISAGGYFQYTRGRVLSIAGGTISAWYSASSGPISVLPPGQNSSGAATPIVCDQANPGAGIAQNSIAKVISGVAGKRISVCILTFAFSAATTTGAISVVYGTGTNCATGQTNLWTEYITASTPQLFTISAGSSAVFQLPVGVDLCVQAGGITANTDVSPGYAIF